jgi:hypothetical protein
MSASMKRTHKDASTMTRLISSRVFGFCVVLGCGAAVLACGGSSTDTPSGNNAKTGSGGSGNTTTTTGGESGSSSTTGTSGTAGGNTGTGMGAGGAASTGDCTSTGMPADTMMSALISDFEGEAGTGIMVGSAAGGWTVDTDMSGMTDLKVEPCGTTGNGLHFTGTMHTGWGADAAATIVSATTPVDASQYTGITFTIKGAKATTVLVKMQNPDSSPAFCQCGTTAATQAANCYAGYAKTITAPTEAMPMTLTWNQITKTTWGYHKPGQSTIDPANLISLAFAVEKGDFDLCIDDVKFTK